ncbi:MAG TPA: hypothetical protein PKA90_14405 [Ignavibacteria bacterium]|nr:hypothetical protein [Ignavibacteria bacterium]
MSNENSSEGFKSETETAFQKAWHSEKGGDADWDSFMLTYGVSPLPDSDRQLLLNSEIKITRGAFPSELRSVFEKIIEKYSGSSDTKVQAELNTFNTGEKVMEYYRKIKPFSGMSDIFSNASATLNKYSEGMQKAKHHTMKCKSCGSPRLEEMQYDSCLFCGNKLFEKT